MAADEAGNPNAAKHKSRRIGRWVLLGLVVLILVLSYLNRASDLVEIRANSFADMITRGDVKKVVLVEREELVEITLTQEALEIPEYRQELEFNSPFGIDSIGPHYKMKISSSDRFLDGYDEITQDVPSDRRVDVQIEDRPDVTGTIINWTFLLILLFLLFMLIRRLLRTDLTRINYRKALLIIFGLIVVIAGISYVNRTPELIEISSNRFLQMAARRDVEKLVLIRHLGKLEVSLSADALQNDVYKEELDAHDPAAAHSDGPHYVVKIASVDEFLDEYEEIAKNIPRNQQVDIQLEERADLTGMLLNWGVLFLLMLGFGMFVKVLAGLARR